MMFLNRMDAQTTVAEENSKIAWKSIEGDVNNEGEMYFIKLSEDETLVTVSTMFDVPLGFVDLPPKTVPVALVIVDITLGSSVTSQFHIFLFVFTLASVNFVFLNCNRLSKNGVFRMFVSVCIYKTLCYFCCTIAGFLQ